MQNDPLLGQQLGAYLIQSKLGEGGMARVYKAYHARLRRDVAIKVILSQVADQEGFRIRFEREAQLIASLEHPNIVAVYDFGEVGNLTYLVMQYVGGGTLRDQLRNGRPLEPRRAIRYALQMAQALHHAHGRGIVHRDVKPQNMLISTSDPNMLLLSDFGIAKLFTSSQDPTWTTAVTSMSGMQNMGSDSSLTNIGQIVGTAEYMSPEQISGKPVDARTDVYALGVVLFQMLTGEVPFHSTTIQGLLYQHVYTLPRSVREVNPYVPEILGQITAKAMAKAPEQRFQSAEEMTQALEFANTNTTNSLSVAAPISPSTFGLSSNDPLTLPAENRATGSPVSHYGQSAASSTPLPVQHTAYEGTIRAGGHTDRISAPGLGNRSVPSLPGSRGLFKLSRIGAGLILLLVIALVVVKFLPSASTSPTTQTSVAQSFTETFQDNHFRWTIGSINGLTASVNPNSYKLDIAQSTNKSTYFPYPANAGTLPTNFTWTVQITRNSGGADVFYGLAFRLTSDGSGGDVHCYAFVIDGNGDYQVLKYSQGFQPALLWSGQHLTAISGASGQGNTLSAIVKGNNFFFAINGSAVNASNTPITDTSGSAPYMEGEPAVIVAGSDTANVSFTVTKAQLTIP